MALPHTGDPIKELEHLAMNALFTQRPPTIQAVTSGVWSNPAVWDQMRIPRVGDSVCIGAGFKVDVDGVFTDPLGAFCVDGGAWLNFLADRNTGLSAATTCICTDDATGAVGKLTIGDVGAPIQPGFSAVWTIADRGIRDAAMQAYDPLDMSGCLMSHGSLRMFGTPKTSWAVPSAAVTANASTVSFAAVPADWKGGDQLVFGPLTVNFDLVTVTPTGYSVGAEDEVRTIVALSATTVTLDTALKYDHGTLRIGNLSRNVIVSSANPGVLSSRGHVMQMHRQDAKVDSVLFKDLGRTNGLVPHTVPMLTSFDPVTGAMGTLVPGTDANTIGRYGGFHAHIRSGATWGSNPICVSNCAVWGSPKHGHNNHGAYMYRWNNVLYKCNGSGLFAENGGEIGADRRNLARCCVGAIVAAPDTRPDAPGVPADNGFFGSGYWFSPGIEQTDNHADGCVQGISDWARSIAYDMSPDGSLSWFNSANLNPPAGLIGPDGNAFEAPIRKTAVPLGSDPTKLDPRFIAAYVDRCVAQGCKIGLFTYQLGVAGGDLSYFGVSTNASQIGWNNPYTQYSVLRNSVIHGSDSNFLEAGSAVSSNVATGEITFDTCDINKYTIGIFIPMGGSCTFKNSKFYCQFPLELGAPWPGTLAMTGTQIIKYPLPDATLIKLHSDMTPIDFNGDTKYKYRFSPFRFILDGQDVIHDCRMPDFVPFPTGHTDYDFNPAWVGLTNAQLFQQFGIWVGGYQIPAQTLAPHPSITSGGGIGVLGPLVGPAMTPIAAFTAAPLSGTAPLAVQFTDQSTNTPTSWLWNFGDGSTSTAQNPSHQYAAAGTYSVSLTATNSGGSNTATKTSLISATVPQVAVPDVATEFNAAIAAAATQAQASLKTAGLNPMVNTPVVTQSPAAGTMVNQGTTVTVS